MSLAQSIMKSPAVVALVVGLALSAGLAGCAKQPLPDNAGGLGLNATPGSQQDFTVNVGDRIFFETDSSALTSTARDYLASRGIPASRLRTISYGKERPVAVCDDISCWSQNRRAVTVLNGAGS